MIHGGATTWYFPDGYLPEKIGNGKLEAHEALMLLNVSPTAIDVKLDVFFEDRPPAKDIPVTVPAERVICLRLDNPAHLRGLKIPPLTQYALRVRAAAPIVAQFGRLDTTQPNLSYYCAPGIWETA